MGPEELRWCRGCCSFPAKSSTTPPRASSSPHPLSDCVCFQIHGRKQTESVSFLKGIFTARIDHLVLPQVLPRLLLIPREIVDDPSALSLSNHRD